MHGRAAIYELIDARLYQDVIRYTKKCVFGAVWEALEI